MLQILIITLISNLVFICFYIKKSNQVSSIPYTELNRLKEYRKRSDEDFLKPSFERWKHQTFRLLWKMWYDKTDRSIPFNEFCRLLFEEEIEIIIER